MRKVTETAAYEKLMQRMRRALVERRQVIDIGDDTRVRFQRKGEAWEYGDFTIEALASGIFILCHVEQGGKRVGGRWMHYGSSDDLECIMALFLGDKTEKELDDLGVIICADAALQEVQRARRAYAAPT